MEVMWAMAEIWWGNLVSAMFSSDGLENFGSESSKKQVQAKGETCGGPTGLHIDCHILGLFVPNLSALELPPKKNYRDKQVGRSSWSSYLIWSETSTKHLSQETIAKKGRDSGYPSATLRECDSWWQLAEDSVVVFFVCVCLGHWIDHLISGWTIPQRKIGKCPTWQRLTSSYVTGPPWSSRSEPTKRCIRRSRSLDQLSWKETQREKTSTSWLLLWLFIYMFLKWSNCCATLDIQKGSAVRPEQVDFPWALSTALRNFGSHHTRARLLPLGGGHHFGWDVPGGFQWNSMGIR